MKPFASDLEPLSGLDGVFLSLETPATPMHVGSLNLFELPPGYSGDFLQDVTSWLAPRLPPLLRRQLVQMPLQLANPVWQMVEVDLDLQLQSARVAAPGGRVELETLVAELHARPLDRSRPLWQLTVIDGLASGQKALYFKIHHAMLDGQAAAALAASLFDSVPGDWAAAPASAGDPASRAAASRSAAIPSPSPSPSFGPIASAVSAKASASPRRPGSLSLLKAGLVHDAGQFTQLVRGLPVVLKTVSGLLRGLAQGELRPLAGLQAPGQSGPVLAPRTLINGPITAERGFATVSLPLAEVKAIAHARRVSSNDVLLTALGGALLAYLARLGPLPEASLTAALALSLRQRGNTDYHNQATLSLVSLATHFSDPLQRLQAVHGHTRATKGLAQQAKALMPTDFPTLGLPWLVAGLGQLVERAGALQRLPPLANVLVSSVSGPARPLYLGPARLSGYWPVSIVEHGVGINLTVLRYTDQLCIGLTLARSAVAEPGLLRDDLLQAYRALKTAALPAARAAPHPTQAAPP